MGLWGFGKKALNSTIGTDEFKSLDNMLMNTILEDGDKNEEILFSNEVKTHQKDYTVYLGSFTLSNSGNIKIKIDVKSVWKNGNSLLISTYGDISSPNNSFNVNNILWEAPITITDTSNYNTLEFVAGTFPKNIPLYIHIKTIGYGGQTSSNRCSISYNMVKQPLSIIKSIQKGVSSTNEVIISTINVDKSIAFVYPNSNSTYNNMYVPKISILGSTKLQTSGGSTSSTGVNVKWVVIEFY